MKSGVLLFNTETLCQESIDTNDNKTIVTIDTTSKIKQFLINTEIAMMVSNRNKVYCWGECGNAEVKCSLTPSRKCQRKGILNYSCNHPIIDQIDHIKKNNELLKSMETNDCLNNLKNSQVNNFDLKYENIMQAVIQTNQSYLHFMGSININKISCTNKVFHFISDDGSIYSCGNDEKHNGILGLNDIYEQKDPIINPFLKDYKIKSLSICDNHACAIDSSGKLFTWGTGNNGELGQNKNSFSSIPTIVNVKATEIKDAKVAPGYTAFKTSGGYLYILGIINFEVNSFNTRESNKKIRQVQGISNYFIRTFCCGEKFLVILTQTGELIYVDEKLSTTKLHIENLKIKRCKEERLEDIMIAKSSILAISKNKLFIWKPENSKPPMYPSSRSGTMSSERRVLEKHIYNDPEVSPRIKTNHKLASFLKASNVQTPRRLAQIYREKEFSQKVFKIIDIDKLYEFKLVDSCNTEFCGLSFVSNGRVSKPFLMECSNKNVGFKLNSSKKDKWKCLVENALEISFSKENSSFYSKLNSCSALKELHRYDSLESFKESSLRLKFKDVRKRLSSQQNLKSRSMQRENSLGEERTFSERVNSYEHLLNSIKVSKNAFDTTMKIKQSSRNDESERDVNLDNFEPLENKKYTVRITNESENIKIVNELNQNYKNDSPHIKDYDIKAINIPSKSKTFNLNSICVKSEENDKIKVNEEICIQQINIKHCNQPEEQESITKVRQRNKRQYRKQLVHNNLEEISKALEFDNICESQNNIDDQILFSNPFNCSLDNDIHAIEEASNETFTSMNEPVETNENNFSLFGFEIENNINREEIKECRILQKDNCISHSQEVNKNTNGVSSISFQRKESSDCQIKELFVSSPIISSPDFEHNNDSCKEKDKEFDTMIADLNINSCKKSINSELSTIQKGMDSKFDITNSTPIVKKYENFTTKFANVLIKICSKVINFHQKRNVSSSFDLILSFALSKRKEYELELIKQKELELSKLQHISKIKNGTIVLNIVIKQVTQNKYSLERKLEDTEKANQTSITEKYRSNDDIIADQICMNKYKLLKMLQHSNINKQLSRMIQIFKNLQKQKLEDAYMQLRSLQFCSLYTVKKLQQQKEKEIKHIEESLALKLKKFEEDNLIQNKQLK